MGRIKIFLFIVCAGVIMALSSCKEATEPEDTTESGSTTNIDTTTGNCANHEDGDDYSWSESDVIPVTLNGSTITTSASGATVNGSSITITSAGTYSFSGSLSNGQIIVNTEEKALVRLILNGASITCNSSAPVYIKNAHKTIVVLADNTVNTLIDGSSYVLENAAEDEPNAALYSKSDLTICGNGTLNVTGNYNDAIATVDGLILKSGTVNVTAKDDGIRGKDYLIVKDGNITVNAKGDGLKSDNSDDASKGYVSVESGTLNITSTADGIDAQTDALISGGNITLTCGGGSGKTVSSDASAKAIKGTVSVIIDEGNLNINSADDGLHSNGYVIVNNGTVAISTGDDGIHAEAAIRISNGDIKITKAVEGIESPSITVNNGTLSITATDDGFNATKGNGGEQNDGSCLTFNGGTVYVNTSKGDGLDSNGSIVMTSGTVVVNGPASSPEVGTDFNGTFNISGGLIIITGPNSGNMIQAVSTSSTQYAVKATSTSQVAASTIFHVQDADGNDVVTFAPVRKSYYVVFSTPALKTGVTYSIYTGGTSTGTNNNGLYAGGTYSGGSLKKSFSISGKVTSVSF